MAKNIEINILNSSGSYETLYPTTDYNNLLNKPTIPTVPSLPLSIANGGTAGNSAANAVYNLLQGLSSRTASNVNSYASSTYLGCYYGSTGYKVPISNLMTYINNNVSSGAKVQNGSFYGNNGTSASFVCNLSNPYFVMIQGFNSSGDTSFSGSYKINWGITFGVRAGTDSAFYGMTYLTNPNNGNTADSIKANHFLDSSMINFSSSSKKINLVLSHSINYFFTDAKTKNTYVVIGQ